MTRLITNEVTMNSGFASLGNTLTLSRIVAAGLISLVMSVIMGAQSPGLSSGAHADSAAVANVVARYHGALSDGDTATALSLLADDAVILESGDIETREEYRAHHLAADIEFARVVPSSRGPVRVVMRGDVAWAVTTSRAQGAHRGRQINSQGAELMVISREHDRWMIRAIHWSSHALP